MNSTNRFSPLLILSKILLPFATSLIINLESEIAMLQPTILINPNEWIFEQMCERKENILMQKNINVLHSRHENIYDKRLHVLVRAYFKFALLLNILKLYFVNSICH